MSADVIDVSYDSETGTYRTTCPRHLDLSTAIVMTIEDIGGPATRPLPPLHSFINVDALDALFSDRVDGTPRRGGEIRFEYAGYDVHVYHHGTMILSPTS